MAGTPGWFARHRDLLAASVSGLVGALALATSTYNVYLQRQQVRAQVWPRLNLDTDWTDDVVTLQVQNRGVGPAQVQRSASGSTVSRRPIGWRQSARF